jgi:xylan 1,4-beta-xylosidase
MKTITVDFAESIGVVKPLHGVNNGPITFGGLLDVSHYFRELGVPYVRIHDPNWPHPREVDIPQIFRQEEADADDPKSYDFSRTDTYLQSILDTGAKIVYRLGVSIEHTKRKYYTDPPKDFAKWARVCVNIIRHYNQGWADGFHHGIQHWEIWNEPDVADHMWTGTFDQYVEMYAAAATAIKALDPWLKVGGYAAASAVEPMGTFSPSRFLENCRERKLPLDFYSWHIYAVEKPPALVIERAHAVRKMLDEHGFSGIESHLNEWNIGVFRHAPGMEHFRRAGYLRAQSEVGASFAAATLIGLQDAGVDVANYYDAQPTNWFCGLFDFYGVPQKTYLAFKAFSEMLAYPERVRVRKAAEDSELTCLAATVRERQTGAVLLSKYGGGEVGQCRLELRGLPHDRMHSIEVQMIDVCRNLDPIRPRWEPVSSEEGITLDLDLMEHAVALIQLR